MKKALVTGGTGFIGSNLCLELEKQGWEVLAVSKDVETEKDNLIGFKGKIKQLDISNTFDLEEKIDVVFHQAAQTDPRFPEDSETIRNNLEGFKKIIEFAKKKDAKLVYASSASVYAIENSPMKEEQDKCPQSAYALSKLIMDEMAKELFDKIHIVGLRYFNVFGPRESKKGKPASMIYHLGKQIKEGKNPRIFYDGEQKRDHIYVKDVVDANIKAVSAGSGIYNVGTGIATSFNNLVKTINKVLQTDLSPEYFESPYGKSYQDFTQADTSKAESKLNFKTKWNLENGIRDYYNWLGWTNGQK